MSRQVMGPIQPPTQWVPRFVTQGVKRPGREVDHSLPSSADIKNAVATTSHTCFHCILLLFLL
jgi:hypothetical protein